jgi:ATP-dependent DNA helicase RecQ
MNFGLHEVQQALSSWPQFDFDQTKGVDSLYERIRQILSEAQRGAVLQKADLQALLRHLLLRESFRSDSEINLRVPTHGWWPSIEEWGYYSVSCLTVGENSLLLTAKAWHPDWLGGGELGVFADAFSDKIVREDGSCFADPFIRDATGYEHYSCPGQREAIRATFLMPYGHTLIVNLPTGSGKSLVGQAPALVNRQEGMTLFVVPTVALAIDQARQMGNYFRRAGNINQTWPLAWYSGLSDLDRAEIRRRMCDGTQRILFTSPEALTTSLLRTVFEVARAGMLKYLVIDEAHLVTQWGDAFRPAFQALAGLRNSLLRQAGINPFRTLLLSATFTSETVETLAILFGPPESVQMVSAVHLRPEPQYWFYRANSPNDKQNRILEALRHAPRPFVLYVTTRDDALRWERLLKSKVAGYQRIERFDGTTPSQLREKIIHDWSDNKLDGVVATSAFGVGIDKSDVRTIIHATIPETLDRFYQEVGRGGRDGKPSVSLLVYDNSDWRLPERLAMPTIISNELGFARWKALYDSRESDGHNELFKINLEAIRQGLPGSNEENVKWNMRTLILMSRARFLELDVEPNNQLSDDMDDFSPSSPLAAMAIVRIRMLRNDHLLPVAWEQIVSPSRAKTLNAGMNNLRLMRTLLLGGAEVASTLADLYRIRLPTFHVDVTEVCGGCPVDRFDDFRKARYRVPIAVPIQNVLQANMDRLCSTFPYLDPRYVLIFYQPDNPLPLIIKSLKWLVRECGIQELCADDRSELAQSSDWQQLYRQSPTGVVIHRNFQQLDEERYSPLARLTFFDGNATAQEIKKVSELQRPFHLVILPTSTQDPKHPNRFLSATATNSIRIEQLIEVIIQ